MTPKKTSFSSPLLFFIEKRRNKISYQLETKSDSQLWNQEKDSATTNMENNLAFLKQLKQSNVFKR